MEKSNLSQSLGQVSVGEAAGIFRDHLRGCVREMICEVMAASVGLIAILWAFAARSENAKLLRQFAAITR